MTSPFPGMDPFLEGYLWPDVHNRLANVIAEVLAPQISPKYVARIKIEAIEVRIPVVEIRDRGKNQLITAIEILSPVNKRKPGLAPYRQKRQSLHAAGVHLLEIDLLRRGTRPLDHPLLPAQHYIISLLRAKSDKTDVWAFDVKDMLPTVPVPLQETDADAVLNLGEAMNIIYERSLYNLSIDYSGSPPKPAFSEDELDWMKTLAL